jgi:hypothetical protein
MFVSAQFGEDPRFSGNLCIPCPRQSSHTTEHILITLLHAGILTFPAQIKHFFPNFWFSQIWRSNSRNAQQSSLLRWDGHNKNNSFCIHPAFLQVNLLITVSVYHSFFVQLIVLLHLYFYGYMFRQLAILRPVQTRNVLITYICANSYVLFISHRDG